MMVQEYGVFEIQSELLYLVKYFDRFCRKHKIRYTLHGGSLLGAVREKGFIPWDDDMDVAMTRKYYKKLVKVLSEHGDDTMYLDAKRDKIKKIWFKTEGHKNVWLDIFIYDDISEHILSQKLKFIGLNILSAAAKSEQTMAAFRTNGRAKGIKRLVYECIYFVSRPFPLEKRLRMLDRFGERAFTGSKQYIHRANDQLWAMPMIIPREYMEHYKMVPFEDTKLMMVENYHLILTQIYGDSYMVPKRASRQEQKVHDMTRRNR